MSAIRERELEVARMEARLRTPRKEAPNLEKLRESAELSRSISIRLEYPVQDEVPPTSPIH